MAYSGIMLTSCWEPPRQFKHLQVRIVEAWASTPGASDAESGCPTHISSTYGNCKLGQKLV
jgi:hypothetical protein